MVEIVCFQNASMYFVKQKKYKYYWMSWGIGRLNVHLIAIVGVAADKIFEAIFKRFIRLFIDDFTVFHDHFHILLLRRAWFVFTFQNSWIEQIVKFRFHHPSVNIWWCIFLCKFLIDKMPEHCCFNKPFEEKAIWLRWMGFDEQFFLCGIKIKQNKY